MRCVTSIDGRNISLHANVKILSRWHLNAIWTRCCTVVTKHLVRITHPEFTVELLQTEPVGGKVAANSFELYVRGSSGRPVSSIVRIVADRTDPDASRRTIKATLDIRSDVTTSEQEQYQLVYRSNNTDEEKPLTALRILLISPDDDPWSW